MNEHLDGHEFTYGHRTFCKWDEEVEVDGNQVILKFLQGLLAVAFPSRMRASPRVVVSAVVRLKPPYIGFLEFDTRKRSLACKY